MNEPFHKRLITGAAWFSVVMLWLCAASVYVSPRHFRLLGVVGMAFPFLLSGVLLMFILSLLFAPRRSWIPLAGLAGCFFSVRAYFPLNLPSEPPEGALKVLSYNVKNFGDGTEDTDGQNVVADYVEMAAPDIFCFQEGAMLKDKFDTTVRRPLKKILPYFDSINVTTNIIGCLSRFPIVGKEEICRHGTNGAVAFKLLPAPGDTLIVVNCHLESMHLSMEDRKKYHQLVKQPEEGDVEGNSRLLVSKISRASVDRSLQADAVADYLERRRGQSVILCGDFNDTPISYTRRRIASGLTDAFQATGNGLGRSFNRDAIIVRIDYLMCSDDWRPYKCTVDRAAKASDHYPIYAWFARR